MKREKFGSRLGFILVSAGCAIGIGNVWKFPYLCGELGGAAFILIYLIFLLIMGIPVLVCEFALDAEAVTVWQQGLRIRFLSVFRHLSNVIMESGFTSLRGMLKYRRGKMRLI